VLQLLSQGTTNKGIADSLFISENTVKTHLRNIMDKLHLANRSQAAAYAVRRGFLPHSE
jgi:DNA-binding NarL/FixJ family response regulator